MLSKGRFALSEVELRDHHATDLNRFVAIDSLCFPAKVAYSRHQFRQLLKSKSTRAKVAVWKRRVIGFVLCNADAEQRIYHIITLNVVPALRGRGIGGMLLKYSLEDAVTVGVDMILLEVAIDNRTAIAMYRAHGFRVIKRLKNYYPHRVDALLMRKQLQSEESESRVRR